MTILNTRVRIPITRHLDIRTTVQYSSQPEKTFLVVPLVSFELTPFSVFYLGSNHTYEKVADAYTNKGDRYFLKIQYLFGT
jgi:hypothetical protein